MGFTTKNPPKQRWNGGLIWSPEVKNKFSLVRKGKPQTPQHSMNSAKGHEGLKYAEKSLNDKRLLFEKLSALRIGKPRPPHKKNP